MTTVDWNRTGKILSKKWVKSGQRTIWTVKADAWRSLFKRQNRRRFQICFPWKSTFDLSSGLKKVFHGVYPDQFLKNHVLSKKAPMHRSDFVWSKMAAILIWFGSPDMALGTNSKAKKPANNTRFCKFFIVIYLSLDIFGLNFLLQKQIFGIFSTLKLLPRWLSNAWHP